MRSRESYFTLEFLADELGSRSFFPSFSERNGGEFILSVLSEQISPICLLIISIWIMSNDPPCISMGFYPKKNVLSPVVSILKLLGAWLFFPCF